MREEKISSKMKMKMKMLEMVNKCGLGGDLDVLRSRRTYEKPYLAPTSSC